MTADDAEHYESHKDDESDWSEVPAPKRKRSEKRRLASIVSVRFTPAEVDELRRRARGLGMSMSGYLRWVALRPEGNFTNTSGVTSLTVAGPVILHYPEPKTS
jgi:hypothetical protein